MLCVRNLRLELISYNHTWCVYWAIVWGREISHISLTFYDVVLHKYKTSFTGWRILISEHIFHTIFVALHQAEKPRSMFHMGPFECYPIFVPLTFMTFWAHSRSLCACKRSLWHDAIFLSKHMCKVNSITTAERAKKESKRATWCLSRDNSCGKSFPNKNRRKYFP